MGSLIGVFDTNIVIDLLTGRRDAAQLYQSCDRTVISRIVWMEVLIGAAEDDADVRAFLRSNFEVYPIDETLADTAIELRRSYRLKLPDALVWATALELSGVLYTRNTKDFNDSMARVAIPYHL